MGNFIRGVIDFFYPPFRKYMTQQFFRYGMTGSMNLVFDWVVYWVIYTFVLQHRMINLGFVTVSSHIAAFGIKIPIVLISGFLMQKYVTFTSSEIRGRIQLMRYGIVFMINLVINYLGLKLFVNVLGFYPTPSNIAISIVTIAVSYFSQKYFIFRNPTSPDTKTP